MTRGPVGDRANVGVVWGGWVGCWMLDVGLA